MSLVKQIEKLRTEATAEDQVEKLWEAVLLLAANADSDAQHTASQTQSEMNRQMRMA